MKSTTTYKVTMKFMIFNKHYNLLFPNANSLIDYNHNHDAHLVMSNVETKETLKFISTLAKYTEQRTLYFSRVFHTSGSRSPSVAIKK